MRIIVLLAFGGTYLASFDAGFKLGAERIDILRGAAYSKAGGGRADIGAVEAIADALRHIRVFRHTGIRAAGAEQRTQHGMARGKDEFFGPVLHLRVGINHFLKRHGLSFT